MASNGKDLQRLIRAIEAARSSGKNFKVESPKRLPDKVTGRLREHDVVLTITHSHHEMIVAIECRDRSRPIGVEAVEAFHTKCQDTSVHSSIMVSSKGFTQPARIKAGAYNIRCLDLNQVETFDWCATRSISMISKRIKGARFYFEFPKGTPLAKECLVDEEGESFSSQQLTPIARAALNSWDGVPRISGDYRVVFKHMRPPIFMIADNERVQAVSCSITVDYQVDAKNVPLAFTRYSENGKDISDAAIATLAMGQSAYADWVMTEQDDGSIAVSIVPNSTKPSNTDEQ